MGLWTRLKHRITGRSAEPTEAPVVTLYTRVGCHLCDDAKALLERDRQRYGYRIDVVDIDADAELRQKYDCCVPVVAVDGTVRFRGRVNEVLFRRLFR